MELKKGDVLLHRFSPTGFYSSAVRNTYLNELEQRSDRQVPFSVEPLGEHTSALDVGLRKKQVYVTPHDKERSDAWRAQGFTDAMKTPDSTLIFVAPEKAEEIRGDQTACMGCLSACGFSNWSQNEEGSTGHKADPRSFCIQKTLQNIAHDGNIDNELMFAGHNAYRFGLDPWYKNGLVPTVKQLVERIASGW